MKATVTPSHGMRLTAMLADIWPPMAAVDSEILRRKKLAVRGGQLALVLMVVAAVAGTILSNMHGMTATMGVELVGAGLAYLLWSLNGVSRAVNFLLQEGALPEARLSTAACLRTVPYFAVQLFLAGLVNWLGGKAGTMTLTWLVLLPPVAHSVILLPRIGIFLVSTVTLVVFAYTVTLYYGWRPVPVVTLQFLFAVLFTVVFTVLAASSEKSRAEVQYLASQLASTNQQLREHAAQVEELAATRERNRLAREIHDNLGHCLTVVNVQLEGARAVWDRDPAGARLALEKAQALTRQSLAEIRHSVAALRASSQENKPLVEALRQLVAESRATGLAVEMQILGESRTLSPQAELTLYRSGQEGLTNVRKHAQVTSARLVLDFRANGVARLSVGDDGVGVAASTESTTGFGLLGLRERAQFVGGTVRIQTAPRAGFTLEVEVPG